MLVFFTFCCCFWHAGTGAPEPRAGEGTPCAAAAAAATGATAAGTAAGDGCSAAAAGAPGARAVVPACVRIIYL